jgi:hypothetical protein
MDKEAQAEQSQESADQRTVSAHDCRVVKRLLGRKMLVMQGDGPVQAEGTKVRVWQGRPQM